MPPELPTYYTIREAAEALGIGYSVTRRYVQQGRLPSVRVGPQYLIPVSAVREFERQPRGNPNWRKD